MGLLDYQENSFRRLAGNSAQPNKLQRLAGLLSDANNRKSSVMSQPLPAEWDYAHQLPSQRIGGDALEAPMVSPDDLIGTGIPTKMAGLLMTGGKALAAKAGAGGLLGAVGHTAWHGSPHVFDKFALEKIGTGEGAQVYGHGLYLAESPNVAKAYQKTLSGDSGGALYKTDIPEEVVAKMLDLDKPMSQQSEHVLSALDGFIKSTVRASRESWFPRVKYRDSEFTGKDLLGQIADERGSKYDGSKTSEFLRSIGIPGNKYFDQGSRNSTAGAASSNFVMFDPEMIRIIERNEQPTGLSPWTPGSWSK